MNKTKIEYLDYTWNPLAMRCTPVSEGCENCWHRQRAKMLAGNPNISGIARTGYLGKYPIPLWDRFLEPCRLKKPSRIGLQFMGDLFHPDVAAFVIRRIFDTIEQCPQHTFIILTKRPERMEDQLCDNVMFMDQLEPNRFVPHLWPNVWFGVSVEKHEYLWRIDHLMKIRAAVHMVSLEPMLGPIDVRAFLPNRICDGCGKRMFGMGKTHEVLGNIEDRFPDLCGYAVDKPGVNWVVAGPETGPGARFMNPAWPRRVKEDCQEADIPFFMKQMSGKEPIPDDLMVREYPA